MNYIKNVFVFLLLSLSSLAALAMPTVAEVETTIAAGDYVKAKEQLNEVLKTNPDSYVANRYMFEIIKIENARDNVASTAYKIYEDKLDSIEIKKHDEKLSRLWYSTIKVISILFIIGIISAAVYFIHRKLKTKYDESRAQLELIEWKSAVMPNLLDIHNTLTRVMNDPKYSDETTQLLFKDLYADNMDVVICLENDDFNKESIDLFIKQAFDFFNSKGIVV